MKSIIILIIILVAIFWCISILQINPMICKYWSWEKSDWKVVKCLKSEDMSKEIVPTYTPTEYVYPTHIIPTDTPEPTSTSESYPEPEITWTPNPYPSMNWLD
jgi:hypothetical protein